MVPKLGNGPGLLNDCSLGREAGLSFHEGSVGTVGAGFRRCWQFGWRRGRARVALVDPGWQKVMGGVGLGPGGAAE